MRFHTTHARDSSLRRLGRINRWLLAGSVTLTGVLTEVTAHAFPSKSKASKATSKMNAAKGHLQHKDSSKGSSSSSKSIHPPAQAPQAAPEPEAEAAPETAHESAAEPAPEREAPPAEEPAPARERAPEHEAAPEPAPEAEAPVVSGGS
jgi:hypothetical protein